jgi:hypothetical protein
MQTTAQMPRKIFNVSHVAKFAAADQANHCSMPRKILNVSHVAKFAVAYQAKHCTKASASHHTQKNF